MASSAVNATTDVDLNADWFRQNYSIVLPIGLVMLVATFCLQLTRAAIRRDGQALGQALTGTISGVIFSLTAVTFTAVALTVTDALSNGLFSLGGTSINNAVRMVVKVSLINNAGGQGWAIAATVAIGCAIGAIMYWGVMIFRKVSIMLLVIMAIFAGAGGGWEPAQRWRRGWIEATATLVFSKLVMTIVFLVGISAIGNSSPKDSIAAMSDIIAGIVIMAIVLLCPFATYKFVHWAADGAASDLHRAASTGLTTAHAMGKKGASMAMRAGTGGAGAAIAPQGPPKVPGMEDSTGISPSGGPDSADDQSPMQTSFKFPGTSQSEGSSGGQQIPNQPLFRRPGQQAPPSESAGGDGGTPLIKRSGSPAPSSQALTEGSAPTPTQAVPPANGPIASSPAAGPSASFRYSAPGSAATSPPGSAPSAAGPDLTTSPTVPSSPPGFTGAPPA